MQNGLVIGLDLGSSNVRAVVGRQHENKQIEILAAGSAQTSGHIIHGEIINIHKTTAAITEALNKVLTAIPNNSTDVFFASNITGGHIQVHPFSISQSRENPRIPVETTEIMALVTKAKQAVAEKNPCVLHTLPLAFKLDHLPETLEPEGQIGSNIKADVLVVTAELEKYEIMMQCQKATEQEHLKRSNLFFSPLATASSILSDEEKRAGVVLVDLGSGTTEISVYLNGRLRHAKVINWGGDRLTEDLVEGLGLSWEHAEALKTRFGSAQSKEIDVNEVVMIPGIGGRKAQPVSVKNVAIILEERLRELAAAIYLEIQKAASPEQIKAGLVLVGGGSTLPDISDLFQRLIPCDCRIGAAQVLASTPAIEDEITHPSYATAIGLAQIYFEQVALVEELMEEESEIVVADHSPSPGIVTQETNKEPKKKPNFRGFLDKVVEVVMGNDNEVGEY